MKGDFELKVIKKSLKQKYTWIKAMEPYGSEFQFTKGFNLMCDIDEFEEKEGIDIRGSIPPDKMKQHESKGVISVIYLTSIPLSEEDGNKIRIIEEDIRGMVRKIHFSPALPKELKLNKTPHITSFIFPLTSIYI